MSKKLGEILVAREQISGAQLAAALQAQLLTSGTRIGTVLVQQEVVRLDAISTALSVQHGVPAAPSELLDDEAAVDEAGQLVPGALCDQQGVIPLRFTEGTLHLAMRDPTRRCAGEISFALGLPIQRYVVPELRLMYLLERWYGIPRDPRFLRTPDRGSVQNERRTYLSPTVQPDPEVPLPEEFEAEESLDLVYLDEYHSPPAGPSSPGVEIDMELEEDVDVDLDLEERDQPTARATAQDQEPELPIDVEEPVVATRLIDVVVARLREAETGDVIAQLLVEPVLEGTALSVLFWVKERWAVGCAAHGTSARQDELQRLVVPLDPPSLLQWAHTRKMVLRADARRDSLLQEVAARLGLPAVGDVCVAPVLLQDEVVTLVCFMSARGAHLSDDAPQTLKRLSEEASAAYRRLVGQIRR